jgi:NAD(P)-dependent dehydrogenase (short-subunit alcohol dehydrogenase family)
MVEARSGSIILQSSGAGLVGIRAGVAYAAAKAGLVGLARQLAADYSSDNVRFNVIAPGTFLTARVQQMYEERVQEGRYESLAAALARSSGVYPLQRVGELEEIAALALFLASDESSFITGVTVPVDGGLTAVRDLVPTASPAR